jgi:hypothetical protein
VKDALGPEDASNPEDALDLEDATKAKDAPNAEDTPNAECATNAEASKVPKDARPSGPCTEEIGQHTDSLKQAGQCSECSILRKTTENLAHSCACFEKQIKGMEKLIAEKDLMLKFYACIDSEIQKLLYRLMGNDIQTGLEAVDGVQTAGQKTVERVKFLNAAVNNLLSENEDLKLQLAVLEADRNFLDAIYEERSALREQVTELHSAAGTEGVKKMAEEVLSELQDKQVSHAFPSFGQCEELKQELEWLCERGSKEEDGRTEYDKMKVYVHL